MIINHKNNPRIKFNKKEFKVFEIENEKEPKVKSKNQTKNVVRNKVEFEPKVNQKKTNEVSGDGCKNKNVNNKISKENKKFIFDLAS